VTVVHRAPTLKSTIKYWVRPDIDNRIKEGSIAARFEHCVKEIRPTSVGTRTRRGSLPAEARSAKVEGRTARRSAKREGGRGRKRRGNPGRAVYLLTGYRRRRGIDVPRGRPSQRAPGAVHDPRRSRQRPRPRLCVRRASTTAARPSRQISRVGNFSQLLGENEAYRVEHRRRCPTPRSTRARRGGGPLRASSPAGRCRAHHLEYQSRLVRQVVEASARDRSGAARAPGPPLRSPGGAREDPTIDEGQVLVARAPVRRVPTFMRTNRQDVQSLFERRYRPSSRRKRGFVAAAARIASEVLRRFRSGLDLLGGHGVPLDSTSLPWLPTRSVCKPAERDLP